MQNAFKRWLCLAQVLVPAALAIPAPLAAPTIAAGVGQPLRPRVTEAPSLEGRNILDNINSFVEGEWSTLGSRASSFIVSGVPQFLEGFPTGDDVKKQLGISDNDLDAKPTQVLNLPPYAYWGNDAWNVRVHGNVYKQPDISEQKLDELANVFLIDVDIADLPSDQQKQARNVTASIYVVQQRDETVVMSFVNDPATSDASTDGGADPAAGGQQVITLPYPTTDEGDYDVFVPLGNTTGPSGGYMTRGDQTWQVQTLRLFANGTTTGNATAYLVPPKGVTVVADIDDILRVTKIYDPKEGLLNSFARPFTPWEDMPSIFAEWSESANNLHFHYLTTTPEQATRNYMEFIYKTYPLGSFDTRPLNFSDVSATLQIRRFLLDKIFVTFPQRQFVLVGDTTNSDVMKAYPALYNAYPGQVSCILLRNTSATDSSDLFPYDTSGFQGIPQENYMFFRHTDDLRGISIGSGQCYNASVPQNVTFGYQNVLFVDAAGALKPPLVSILVGALIATSSVLLNL